MGVANMGLLVLMALRKEGKDEAQRRQDECVAREQKLLDKIEACDGERQKLLIQVAKLEAKQEVWDKVLPHFKFVESREGGRRQYDDPAGGTPHA